MTGYHKQTTKLHMAKIKHKDMTISDRSKYMTKMDTTDGILNLLNRCRYSCVPVSF